ncbi:flagellar biosynthesis protein FlgE [Halovibrio salipaludis]|uniref:Flagellar hook protein FlgE n=1 Tax=Halovibrio salipaludis TaxID=2032626 RepID=A0A2A2F758_9GAMM|nr:flagellar hook protein FlgE [Halovibrio salipaludis]PAU80363.1 flagellar biosynthesis protein FlgE [Halovibrio salipaludis]
MAFNIALSGLNAAQTDLDVKGNNIANASTTGFKRSRAEFGDLYSSGLLNLGSTDTGEGVRVQNTRQLFQQGNVTATSNGLDMAINGEGFFVVNNGGEQQFTRAGEFGVNQEGFITNNQGARVQGFQANEDGEVGDVRGDLEVNTENLAPKRTTDVDANLNLDAREEVIREEFRDFDAAGDDISQVVAGSDSFDAQGDDYWEITRPDESTYTLGEEIPENSSAATIAQRLTQEDGLRVDATNQVRITDLTNIAATDEITIGTQTYTMDGVNNLDDLRDKILDEGAPDGISVDPDVSGEVLLKESEGNNINVSIQGTNFQAELDAPNNSGPVNLDTTGANTEATARGTLNFQVDRGYEIAAGDTKILDGNEFDGTDLTTRNPFNPDDPNTYNHSTSTTIYDSLGNGHELTQYFVKEPSTGTNPENLWKSYVQIDGENVGPDDSDGNPTLAEYELRFNDDGSLNGNLSDEVLIDNWTPLDAGGNPNGAAGPNPGGEAPIPEPPQSSNFVIDYGNTTQVGAEFAVNDLQQDGFSTGRLTGLDVTDDGVIQARFSNGESEAIGQVALANFRNNEGLAPVGDTAWVETFESGDAVISRPNTGPLGAIQSSSVEESNVDLSEQLVGLITAQRNFQANSKTIETSDQITQTIINLR